LLAHVCPDPAMFDRLNAAIVDGPAAVTDAAEMLRRFNEPDGIAHTAANRLAEQRPPPSRCSPVAQHRKPPCRRSANRPAAPARQCQ
jgi:hypothetical protein